MDLAVVLRFALWGNFQDFTQNTTISYKIARKSSCFCTRFSAYTPMISVKRQRSEEDEDDHGEDIAADADDDATARIVKYEERHDDSLIDKLRGMALRASTFPTKTCLIVLNVRELYAWTRAPGNFEYKIPDCIASIDPQMRLVGLEVHELPLSEEVRCDMRRQVSGFWQTTSVPMMNGVTLSLNRKEARILSGWRVLSSVLSFVEGECNMELENVVVLKTGRVVGEIPYSRLESDQQRHFLDSPVRFHCFDGLDDDTENRAKKASWDGYASNPFAMDE